MVLNDVDKNGRLTTEESVAEYLKRNTKEDYGQDCLSITGRAIHLVGFPENE